MSSKWGSFEFEDLKKLAKNLEGMQKEVDALCIAIQKELGARLLAKTVKRTPVGQYSKGSGKDGGTLRRGWQVTGVTKNGDTYEIELSNPIEYAPYVEYGHRTPSHTGWVPGQFMMTISEKEIESNAAAIIEKKVTAFLMQRLG